MCRALIVKLDVAVLMTFAAQTLSICSHWLTLYVSTF